VRSAADIGAARLVDEVAALLGPGLAGRLARARGRSWSHHGRRVTFYLPGMFRIGDRRGRYPAVSITGGRCELACAHCAGRLLEPMIPAETPEALVETARKLAGEGALGILVTGGSDREGHLPWGGFLDALREIKRTTPLQVSVHAGLVDEATARGLAQAGVDAALLDVIGSAETMRDVFHLDGGPAAVEASLDALAASGVRIVPHVVIGFRGGGEERAVEMIAGRGIRTISFVVFMPLRGTALEAAEPPDLVRVAEVLAFARERMPEAVHSLGCARPRDEYGHRVEAVALVAGANRLAVATEGAETAARELGLQIARQETCCSVDLLEEGRTGGTA
jgi:hypothetical protein